MEFDKLLGVCSPPLSSLRTTPVILSAAKDDRPLTLFHVPFPLLLFICIITSLHTLRHYLSEAWS
jgi:hypothetical protein